MIKLDQPKTLVDGGLAIKIGELFCDALYGDLSRQKPLSASDQETYWRVEGNWNRDGVTEGLAEFFLSIAKMDGRVTDVGEAMRVNPHPSVTKLLNEPDEQKGIGSIDPGMAAQCMLRLTSLSRGALVFSEELAVKLGEAFCQTRYGDLKRQAPLMATDRQTYWRVEGNWNRESRVGISGPFFLSINKYDGRVIAIGE